jgi:hypothetical protein
MTRRTRREIDRRIVRAIRRTGKTVPDFYPCSACGGDGKRWRVFRWRFGRCRSCRGTGKDPVRAIDRLRFQVVLLAAQKKEQVFLPRGGPR